MNGRHPHGVHSEGWENGQRSKTVVTKQHERADIELWLGGPWKQRGGAAGYGQS